MFHDQGHKNWQLCLIDSYGTYMYMHVHTHTHTHTWMYNKLFLLIWLYWHVNTLWWKQSFSQVLWQLYYQDVWYLLPAPQVHDSIMKRLAMSTLAQDMDSWIEKRDELSRKIDDLRKQKETIMKGKVSAVEAYDCLCMSVNKIRTIMYMYVH